MKKIASGIFLFIFIFAVEVTYINYRLEQKLDDLELNQQNILTKVYSLERHTEQVNQNVNQIILKQQPTSDDKHKFFLTNSEQINKKNDKQKMEGIN